MLSHLLKRATATRLLNANIHPCTYIHCFTIALFHLFAGIRYAFIGKTVEQRASYRVLGTLLFTQLAITASLGAIGALAKSLAPQAQQSGESGQADKDGHAVLLQVWHLHRHLAASCARLQ